MYTLLLEGSDGWGAPEYLESQMWRNVCESRGLPLLPRAEAQEKAAGTMVHPLERANLAERKILEARKGCCL
jgi:hypothetical protein